VLVATSEAIDELKDVNEPDTVAELNVVTPDKLDPSPIKTFAVIVPDALIAPDDVTLDPFTIIPSLPNVPIFTISPESTSKIGIPEMSLTVNNDPERESVIENSCP
jgi:hypothetical protein